MKIQRKISQTIAILGIIATIRVFALSSEELLLTETSQPSISVKVNYYPIKGSTAAQLRKQMDQFGPPDPNSGLRYDAYTKWNINWHYYYTMSDNQCSISSVSVDTTIVITLPRWDFPSNAPPQLIEKWNKFLFALQSHENEHQQNGIKASREILSKLQHLGAYSDCQQLEYAANSTADRIIKKYNQEDISYDQRTRHGKTEGVIFP